MQFRWSADGRIAAAFPGSPALPGWMRLLEEERHFDRPWLAAAVVQCYE